MIQPPNFIRNSEEWIIWLLDLEFSGSATPEALSSRTGLPPDSIHDNFLYMERVGLVSLVRDSEKQYPDEVVRVHLTDKGRTLSKELKQRPDPGDLF